MQIGIDASRAITSQRTGTEGYAAFLIQSLIPQAVQCGHEIHLFFRTAPPADTFPPTEHVHHHVLPFPRLWTHVRLGRYLDQHRPDVFFTPAHVIPLGYEGPSVATIHDLGFHYFPKAHGRQVAYLNWSTRHNARRSTQIIADSQATKNDLILFYDIDPQKINVVYPGRDPNLTRVRDPEIIAAVQRKYGIHAPYLLYLGTLQPRKNLVRLLRAHTAADGPQQLVLAGKVGWQAQEILDMIKAVGPGRVHMPGYVAEADKAALISGATALLYPSLYEGFGFPLLEAMACGTPVLSANNSSMPEVAGTAALLVDAEDEAAIRNGIQRLVTDDNLRAQLQSAGYANLVRFNWEIAAFQTIQILEQAANQAATTEPKSFQTVDIPWGTPISPVPVTLNPPAKIRLLGIPVHIVTMSRTINIIADYLQKNRLHQIATVNPEFVMRAQRDPEFRATLQEADLCLADGIGIVLAARWHRRLLPGRVPGSELIYYLAERGAQEGWRFFLLGAAPGVAEDAARILQQRYPGLIIADTYAGSPDPAENDAIVQRINASKADILLVAYGAPRQDVWIARNKNQLLTVRMAMGIGGTLDFVTGRATRAPKWVQDLGLEWLHRLIHEPWRWRRMLALPSFILRTLFESPS